MSILGVRILLLAMLSLLLGSAPQAPAAVSAAEASRLIVEMAGPDAVAESRASRRLVELADGAVPALASAVRTGQAMPPRLVAVELLGRIGTPAAMESLIDLLRTERNLAVRGQICMQLGHARERRAVPMIAAWLRTIGPSAINDVPGPKEVQPSTCYLRHVEALGMIGDEQAIPMLREFAAAVPPGIGFGGFISGFVRSGVDEAVEEIRERAAFDQAIRRNAGLAEKTLPLFQHLRRDPVARFRLHESELIRHTPQGKAIIQRLATEADPAVAAGAKAMLDHWDNLAI